MSSLGYASVTPRNALNYSPNDYAVGIILGESKHPMGQLGVASVLANRQDAGGWYGKNIYEVGRPNQFNGFVDPRTVSPEMRAQAQRAWDAASGGTRITNALNYANPDVKGVAPWARGLNDRNSVSFGDGNRFTLFNGKTPTIPSVSDVGDYAKGIGTAALDKAKSAASAAAALPGKAYDVGAGAVTGTKNALVNAFTPPSNPNGPIKPTLGQPSGQAGWLDASGHAVSGPFGAVSYGLPSTAGMSAPGAFMSGLAHPVQFGQGGILPGIFGGITNALAQLFGVSPAQAAPFVEKQAQKDAPALTAPAPSPVKATPLPAPIDVSKQPMVTAPPAPAPATSMHDKITAQDHANLMNKPAPLGQGAQVLGRPLSPDSTIMDPQRLGGAPSTPKPVGFYDRTDIDPRPFRVPVQPQQPEALPPPTYEPAGSAKNVPIPPSPSQMPSGAAAAPPIATPTPAAPGLTVDNLFGLGGGQDLGFF